MRYCATIVLTVLTACSQNYSDRPVEEALVEHGLRPIKPHATIEQSLSSEGQTGDGPTLSVASSDRQSLGGISVVVPSEWVTQPASGMRLAEYRLSGLGASEDDYGAAKEELSVTVFYFGPNQGGTVEANIQRWVGQFSQPDGGSSTDRTRRWTEVVAGLTVTQVDVSGTFNGGMGPDRSPEPNYRMLGAIAMAPVGPFFFKLVGSVSGVEAWSDSFGEFIASIRSE